MSAHPERLLVGTRPDGSEILVTLWSDGHADFAERPGPMALGWHIRVWGPPIRLRPAPSELQ